MQLIARLLRRWKRRDVRRTRPWIANAIIAAVAQEQNGGRRPARGWQCAQAPALVVLFRRRRGGNGSWPSLACAGLLATACLMVLWPGAAGAQGRCAEGRTASGQCVNAPLAENARLSAIVFAQPKISLTAFPVLPSGDANYRYPNQLIPDPLKPSATGTPLPPPD
jgi:hypothetical protein